MKSASGKGTTKTKMAQAAALSFLLLLAIYAASVVLGETRQQKFKIRRIVKSKWTATETSNRGTVLFSPWKTVSKHFSHFSFIP